jgi:COMPASS component SWD3
MYDNLILTGSWRPTEQLQIWDFGSGNLIETLPWPLALGEEPCLLYAAQFSKNNGAEFIAAGGSGSNETRVIHRKTGKVANFSFLDSEARR